MNLITGRNTRSFAKDAVYRFMKMIQINWIRFTTILASRIIKDDILPLDSKDRANVLIIDDSMFERNRSKKVEFIGKVFDHAKLMEAHFFQLTVFFFLLKIRNIVLTKPKMLIKGQLDISAANCLWKKEHMSCWNC